VTPNRLEELRIGNSVAELPIVQGGMAVGISLSGLASAVANEGAVGVIATAAIGFDEPDFFTDYPNSNIRALRKQIRRARSLTDGILGVNIMVALSNFADMVRTSIEEGIDVIFSGAGLPLNLPGFLVEGAKTKLVPIVSSARAARIIARRWKEVYDYVPDAFVLEGPKAGGHLGFKLNQIDDPHYRLENLVPEVAEQVHKLEESSGRRIPLIAGGGVYTGEDMVNILQLGASAVQMATRFVTTHECDAAIEFKQAYIDSREEDSVIIKSPVGMPGRAIRGRFLDEVEAGQKKPFKCAYHCISTCNFRESPYCIAMALVNAAKGNLKHGFVFAGSNAFRAEKISSVKEVVRALLAEYDDAVRHFGGRQEQELVAGHA